MLVFLILLVICEGIHGFCGPAAMPPPLPVTVKDRITEYIAAGAPKKEIMRIEHVSRSSISRIKDNLLTWGSHTRPDAIKMKPGTKPIIEPVAREGLASYLRSKPWAYLEEMASFLLDDFEILASITTIWRALKEMKINQKAIHRVALERSQLCRDGYTLEISNYTYDQLIYLDESRANEHTCLRKRGWSPFGIIPEVVRPVKRSERWSILPAYCVDGILASHVYHGGINAARFEWFLENEVLPRCNPFPGPKSVIVLDNCSSHCGQGVRDLCALFGVRIVYLPPYSPDFNPIEEFFSVLKAWMKKNFLLAEGVDFEDFIRAAVRENSHRHDAPNHFRHTNVAVPAEYGRE